MTVSPVPPRPVVPVRRGLSIGDGFKFGCGLILSMIVFSVISTMLAIGGVLIAQSLGLLPNLGTLTGVTTAPLILPIDLVYLRP